MILERTTCTLALALAIGAGSLTGAAEEKPAEKRDFLLWDGKELVAAYAKRAGLDPETTLDLGGGVKMEFIAFG